MSAFAHERLKMWRTRYCTRVALFGASVSCIGFITAVPAQTIEQRSLEEVIVTAQKRAERLKETPVPVAAVSGDALVESNQVRIQDYYAKVPGFSFTTLGDVGVPVLTIRGITTGGYTNPTVAVMVDDVPFGASSVATGGAVSPDIDPSELSRIEVLRGPQGTLYGASSLGGLLKYVTSDPSPDALSGRLQVGSTSVRNGDGLGYSVRGALNIPLGGSFAARASAFTRKEPGYIDDPALGREGVNQRDIKGGRLSALWRPSDDFSLRLSALLQQSQRDGEDTAHLRPGLGDLQHSDLRGTGWYDINLQAYSATMAATLGSVELTSITGYSINEISSVLDATPALAGPTQTRFGVPSSSQAIHVTTYKFTEELRLSMPISDSVDWMVGGFYAYENYPSSSRIAVIDPASGAEVGVWQDNRFAATYDEYAAFTNVTFKLTDRFDVQLGGRAGKITVEAGEEDSVGPFNTAFLRRPEVFAAAGIESKQDSITYLVTPRLRLSPDLMVYARLASGYRPGAPNTTVAVALGLPQHYEEDTTQNYEIGLKGEFLNNTLFLDASVYYIDWKDVQIQLRDLLTNQIYFTNLGQARSQGVEVSIETTPISGLTIAAWGAWNDAEMTRVPPGGALTARPGDQLPYSSKLSGNLSIDQEFPLWSGASGFLGASVSYVDDRKGRFFGGTLPRQEFPGYTQVDARVGAKYGTWTINAFVNNLSDQRGVLRGGRDASLSLPYSFTYIQPRTIGISASKTF